MPSVFETAFHMACISLEWLLIPGLPCLAFPTLPSPSLFFLIILLNDLHYFTSLVSTFVDLFIILKNY